MLTGVLLILAPLFLGFAISISNRRAMTVIHYLVETMVYLILGMLGLGLGQMEGLGSQLSTMASQVLALVALLLLCNMGGLWLFHRWRPLTVNRAEESASPSYRRLIMAAFKPLIAALAGLLLGYYLLPAVPFIDQLATGLLMLLLLLIGLQLRNAGLSLRKLLVNVQGLGIALVLMASSMMAGVLLIPVLGLPWNQTLRRHRYGFHSAGDSQQRWPGLRAGGYCVWVCVVVFRPGIYGAVFVIRLGKSDPLAVLARRKKRA